MVTTIRSKTSKKEFKKITGSIKSREKLLIASKYSGKIKIIGSPVEIQKKLQNE